MGNGLPGGGGGQSLGIARASIQLDTSSLQQGVASARQAGQQIQQALGQINTGAVGAQKGLNQINTGARAAQGGISGLTANLGGLTRAAGIAGGVLGAIQLVRLGADLAQAAANADRVRTAFDNLAESSGQSGARMLATMQKTSRGMISDNDLILASNKAMLLGVADSGEEMGQLLDVARVRGQAMGISASQAFDNIVTGIGRMSPRILDNLGIVIDADQAFETYAASIGRAANSLTDAQKRNALFNAVIAQSAPMVAASGGKAETSADKFDKLDASFKNTKKAIGELVLAAGAPTLLDGLNTSLVGGTKNLNVFIESLGIAKKGIIDLFVAQTFPSIRLPAAPITGPATSPFMRGIAANQRLSPGDEFTPEQKAGQLSDKIEHSKNIQSIDRAANADRLAATQQYESQRSETIRSYEQNIAREEQDFGIARTRAAEQLADTIAGIQEDSAKQAARWADDLADSIAKLQKDSGKRLAEATEESNKRIAEINQEYADSREKAERSHNDTLMEAAGNLDAKAVYQEQKRFAEESKDADDNHKKALRKQEESLDERTQKEQANLAERIAEEQEANAKRLADAKEADIERIQDAKDALAKQQVIEDENRALTLQREAEDHAAQLAQMAAAQAAQLAQITQHAKDARDKEDEDFQAALEKDGVRNAKWIAQHEALVALATKEFDRWYLHALGAFGKLQGPPSLADQKQFVNPDELKGWASGGYIPQNMIAKLHMGEVVLNKAEVNRLGGYGGVQRMAAGGGRSVSVGNVSFNIYGAPGMNPDDIADAVDSRLHTIWAGA